MDRVFVRISDISQPIWRDFSGDFRKYQGMANEQYWKGFGVNTATEVQTKLEGIQGYYRG